MVFGAPTNKLPWFVFWWAMTAFTRKKLEGSVLLGERIRELREEEGMTQEDLARRVFIPVRHIRALESGEYGALPGDVYVRQYLKKIAPILKVDTERMLSWYARERSVASGVDERLQESSAPPRSIGKGFTLSPRFIRTILFTLALAAVAGYLAWQLQQVFRAPELIVTSPPEDFRTQERTAVIEGSTEPEAEVRVNDREVPVDQEGVFREQINLRDGLNTIRITAKRGRSATAVVQRLVFVEEKQE